MGFLVLDEDYQSQTRAKIQASQSPDGVLCGNLQCEITLPLLTNPPGNRLACHETGQETAYVSGHISSRIHAWFSQLAAHAATNSSTSVAPEGIALGMEIAPQSFDIYPECDHRRYHSRRLHLHDPETLPVLPFVHKLSVESAKCYDGLGDLYGLRPVSLLVPLQCIAALPNIHTLLLPWMWERPMPYAAPSTPVREHYARPWEGPLRDARHDFGNAICDQEKFLRGRRIPASLKNALLHFWEPEQTSVEDQSVARPDLIHPAGRDPVSVGLCRLAVHLERLDLRALVTEDLFPGEGAEDRQWSSMQRLRIEFHPLRPDGMWYFVGPRGEDPLRSVGSGDEREGGFRISETMDYPREYDTAEDQDIDEEFDEFPNGDSELDYLPDLFRTEPHRERVEPLLARFAAAVATMTRLEDAEMFAHIWWTPSETREKEYAGDAPYDKYSVHRWGVRYLAGRGGGDNGEGKTTSPVVQWQVGDWRPSTGVMALFEELGTQEWLGFDFTEGRPKPTTDDAMRARLF
ncbi:putative conserved hypothetical protein [Colletotrichum sublineola]|uniref:Uncharacterized protein n=1 Tax=Colletotrichum sublineola TaxID=1173701 RepID=A0A066XRF7_COLSU|nr:putative conserved hypothetical protein [Colletotrichum sublineola]